MQIGDGCTGCTKNAEVNPNPKNADKEIRVRITVPGAQGIRFHLKPLKYYVSKKV